jgi:bifunctional UDP-N-acetylglucosamine pyrophosphorylase/glucosamine-1-phosphate N-acetyltransferase
VGDNVTIHAFSHIEGAHIAPGAHIGPFARLRPGTQIGENVKIGNFVEVKNSTMGKGAKANHLAYIGDADIGVGVNFSCGAITVNYDGFEKHRTVVGDDAFVGCNANLIAPITVGRGALVAAGSTLAKDVPADALAVAREKPMIKEGYAATRRARKKKAV